MPIIIIIVVFCIKFEPVCMIIIYHFKCKCESTCTVATINNVYREQSCLYVIIYNHGIVIYYTQKYNFPTQIDEGMYKFIMIHVMTH